MARLRVRHRLLVALALLPLTATLFLAQPAGAQQTPPALPPPFEGPAPRPGDVALLRTSRAVTPSDLSAGLTLAGCTPTVIAITVGGQWQIFVAAPAAPTFVNAPFLATVPTLAAGTGFFVRCEPAPLPTGLTLAPIESVEVVRSDSATPSYWAVITSGLPGGCTKFERIDSSRSGDLFAVTVLNRTLLTFAPCTAIYGYVTNRVPLTGDLVIGRAYTLRVNDQTTSFVAGSTGIRVGGPPAPTNVRLSGPLADTDLLVPAGEAESGRVSVLWDAPLPATAALTGFRIYERDCSGVPTGVRIEAGVTARSFGPLQPCRPGGSVGVAAVSAAGESPITWSR